MNRRVLKTIPEPSLSSQLLVYYDILACLWGIAILGVSIVKQINEI